MAGILFLPEFPQGSRASGSNWWWPWLPLFTDMTGNIPFIRLWWWLRWQRICLQWRRPEFSPWVRKIPWRREWQPTPVFLPGKFHGQRSLAGSWGRKESDRTEWLTHSIYRCEQFTDYHLGGEWRDHSRSTYIFLLEASSWKLSPDLLLYRHLQPGNQGSQCSQEQQRQPSRPRGFTGQSPRLPLLQRVIPSWPLWFLRGSCVQLNSRHPGGNAHWHLVRFSPCSASSPRSLPHLLASPPRGPPASISLQDPAFRET